MADQAGDICGYRAFLHCLPPPKDSHAACAGFVSGPIDYFHLVLENGPHNTTIYSQGCPVRR
jgi:hypothetical protein